LNTVGRTRKVTVGVKRHVGKRIEVRKCAKILSFCFVVALSVEAEIREIDFIVMYVIDV